MTIVVAFHYCKMRTFKDYYLSHQIHLRSYFPKLVSYNRFIEWMLRTIFSLFCDLLSLLKSCSGISFMDSTILSVCHIRRASSHKTFQGLASKGKTSPGWLFGLKLHWIVNEKGELVAFPLTDGSVHDLAPMGFLVKNYLDISLRIKAICLNRCLKDSIRKV